MVPIAAMNKNHLPQSGKDEVGTTGKVLPMQSKAKSEGMSDSPYGALGPRILAPNTGHDASPCRWYVLKH